MHHEVTKSPRLDACPAVREHTNQDVSQGFRLEGGVSPDREVTGPFEVHLAALPNGKRIPLLKTGLTTGCERNCYYCAFRSGRDFRRETFKPEELARLFMQLYRGKLVQGLFLSSGITGGGVRTQDRLLATAEILREKYHFRDYLHLKIMPGAEKAQVEYAMRLADRVSINLEAPSTKRLAELAPEKSFQDELLQPLRWIEDIRKNQPAHQGWNGRWPSSTTQYVVGAVNENDLELLQTTFYLHKMLNISRAYFSSFNPVKNTPLENHPAANPWREVRLYQASFLLRDYGFDFEDLIFDHNGDLHLDKDPKLLWAEQNIRQEPLEINRADLHELLRIPGIGPKGARKIISSRRQSSIQYIEQLKSIGIHTRRAAPFILLNGVRPSLQLSLFEV
ncbi:MAG: helix-hairpin-helix domain-containing protein [Anaerolineaceae bacterium]|nr:helix-hairpin-helix domain-containing protein [Anaerolineaceae bacterium]